MNIVPPPVRGPGQTIERMIVDGSPLAIIGIFVAFLRERFAPGNGPDDYQWYEDPYQSTILIESGFEPNVTKRDKIPGIYVDKDESVYGKSIIGDRAGHTIHDAKDFQWCLSTVPVTVDCVSGRKGESAIIGDIVQWSLHASSDAIQAAFSLHDMTPPTLGKTVPYEDAKETWTTPVSFNVQYNVRWTSVPVAPLLQQIALRIRDANADPETYLLHLVTGINETLPDS